VSSKTTQTASKTMESPHRPSSTESVSLKEEQEKPWKYVGYKVFSRWIASDPSFFVLRRFGTLNARVALSLQDEIAELETKLDFMDKRYSSRDVDDLHNGSFRDESFLREGDRQTLITEVLPQKLTTYSKSMYILRKLTKYSRLCFRQFSERLYAARFTRYLQSQRCR
jgi:hypothetical protein